MSNILAYLATRERKKRGGLSRIRTWYDAVAFIFILDFRVLTEANGVESCVRGAPAASMG